MKIGVILDTKINSGGGLHMIMSATSILKNLKINNVEVEFICTNKDIKKKIKNELNIDSHLFNKELKINKIKLFLQKINFIKDYIIRKSNLNTFENFLEEKSIDLVYFVSPSSLVNYCHNFNFLYSIWEFQYKNTPFFPEYKNNFIDNRDTHYNFAIKRAFRIILGNKKYKKDFAKTYNFDEERISIVNFPPYIPKKELSTTSDILEEKIKGKKFLFYPSQFWAHKNHEYLVSAITEHNKNNANDKIFCIFTSANNDKGNLSYIKKLIKNKNSQEYFIFFDYLSDGDIARLYKKSLAVIFPSYVGSHSFPLWEGFYFKKPVIFNQYTLDSDLKKFVFQLDVNSMKSLTEKINFIKNNVETQRMVNQSNDYYNLIFDEKYIHENIKEIVNSYVDFSKKWKF